MQHELSWEEAPFSQPWASASEKRDGTMASGIVEGHQLEVPSDVERRAEAQE